MVKWTLIILGLLCLITIVIWFTYPKGRNFFESLGSLFTLLSSFLALTVFLQFYNEIEKTKKETAEKRLEEREKFNARMAALGSEIINNIQLCNLFEAEKENNLKGIEVPSIYFEHSVMSNVIINGDITYHKLRSELSSLILQMKSINNLIQFQQQLMTFKYFASIERRGDLTYMTMNSMKLLHSKIPIIKNQLINTEPYFKEFWNNPKKYLKEEYLKENMLPDALIR